MNKKEYEPRQYQMDLLEYVTHRNGIIYLPTGAGKTFVAVMAIKRFSHKLQETIENGGKRAIFMCNTIELARQQAIELKRSTNLKIGFYVGERDTDNWSRKKWDEEITENQVLVGTIQIFLDIVSQNIIKINDLSIVVVDECHHATGDHPMLSFMRLFERADQSDLPRVIGLTGVLIKGNKLNKVEQELKNLEAVYRGNIITVNSIEEFQNVLIYSTKPTEEFVFYSTAKTLTSTEKQIDNIISKTLKLTDSWPLGAIPVKYSKNLACAREPSKKNFIKNLLKDFLYQMNDFGLFTASFAIESVIIELELKKRSAETITLRNLYRCVITQCEYVRRLIVKRLMDTVDDYDPSSQKHINMDAILDFSSPKMLSFLTYVQKKFSGKSYEDICSLVFVQRRYSAKCVFFVLKAFVELSTNLRDIIKPQFMVGRNAAMASIESLLEQKWNRSAIEDFRKGECNLIICSNVLEEGIDLQECSYVCTLDPLTTFNSYIQTKGRARRSNSNYTIFAAKSDQDKVCRQLKSYREVHECIKQFLIGRTLDREDPTEDEIATRFANLIPPFEISSGAVLLASSALTLLHRYCQNLPNDSFGSPTPWYTVSDWNNGKVIVSIDLPMQSTVKETIRGNPMESRKLAKMSAAFKACKRLYENKELNEKLLPVTKRECVAQVSADLFNHWAKYNDAVTSRAFQKQFRRLYDRMCPQELYESMPIVGQKCYAYEIKITPLFEKNSYNEHIVKLLNGSSNFAILLRKKLPKLAEMPLFMNQGKLNVQIMNEPLEIILKDQNELDKLIGFHIMLFRDLLKSWKQFFVIDRRNKDNSFLLTPVNRKNGTIDWTLIGTFQYLDPVRKYTVAERQSMVFRPEDYMGKVVSKWYGELNRSAFIVTNVRTDQTPLTAFPSNEFANYGSYMEKKYGTDIDYIVKKDQFLLEVRQIPNRRNFYNNAMGKEKAINKFRGAIILIPETCCNFKFPGELWLKAIFLPSILSRLHYMLHAEELRVRIDRFLGFQNNSAYNPKPLMIDTSLKRAIDIDGNMVEDTEEEPKKLLTSLVSTTSQQNKFDSSAMCDNVTWKDYLEPCDFFRKPGSVHQVELNYYYNFVSGLTQELKELNLGNDGLWTKSQLKIPSPTKLCEPTTTKRPCLALTCGEHNEHNHRINILEKSLGSLPLSSAEQFEYLAAITTSKASDVFDMERFEILGDSFLKFATTLLLVNKYSNWHEGFFTEVKSKFVSNRNLLYCMLDTDIPKRISGTLFKPNHQGCWVPPFVSIPNNLLQRFQDNDIVHSTLLSRELYNLELTDDQIRDGNCSETQVQRFVQIASKIVKQPVVSAEDITDDHLNGVFYKQSLPDKIVSDTLEALLGVCVKNYGIYHSFRMLEFFGLCKSEHGKSLSDLLDLKFNSSLLRTNISSKEVDGFLVNHEILESNLGYKFKDRSFLLQALTHPSYPTNRITGCYQVLEFIGDAILDFLVSSYIFEQHLSMTPGKLTDLRSALVNNITLACVCVRHRFHLYLLAENSVLSESISNFEKFQENMNYRVTDQVNILMEEDIYLEDDDDDDDEEITDKDIEKPFNMSANVDVPKALGDVVEALIAAVFLDSRDLRTTWNVIYKLLEQEFNDFSKNVPIEAVRRLYEHKHADPIFDKAVIENNVAMVKCEFTCLDQRIYVNGFGSNSSTAKKAAAKHALKILDRQTE